MPPKKNGGRRRRDDEEEEEEEEEDDAGEQNDDDDDDDDDEEAANDGNGKGDVAEKRNNDDDDDGKSTGTTPGSMMSHVRRSKPFGRGGGGGRNDDDVHPSRLFLVRPRNVEFVEAVCRIKELNAVPYGFYLFNALRFSVTFTHSAPVFELKSLDVLMRNPKQSWFTAQPVEIKPRLFKPGVVVIQEWNDNSELNDALQKINGFDPAKTVVMALLVHGFSTVSTSMVETKTTTTTTTTIVATSEPVSVQKPTTTTTSTTTTQKPPQPPTTTTTSTTSVTSKSTSASILPSTGLHNVIELTHCFGVGGESKSCYNTTTGTWYTKQLPFSTSPSSHVYSTPEFLTVPTSTNTELETFGTRDFDVDDYFADCEVTKRDGVNFVSAHDSNGVKYWKVTSKHDDTAREVHCVASDVTGVMKEWIRYNVNHRNLDFKFTNANKPRYLTKDIGRNTPRTLTASEAACFSLSLEFTFGISKEKGDAFGNVFLGPSFASKQNKEIRCSEDGKRVSVQFAVLWGVLADRAIRSIRCKLNEISRRFDFQSIRALLPSNVTEAVVDFSMIWAPNHLYTDESVEKAKAQSSAYRVTYAAAMTAAELARTCGHV